MSSGARLSWNTAHQLAMQLLTRFEPYCERVQICGSLRRLAPDVGDLEIIAIPKLVHQMDLLGGAAAAQSLLDKYLEQDPDISIERGKDRMKKLYYKRVPVDLFLQPDPRTWGVNFLIRTGSRDFSHWAVTHRSQGGALPAYLEVQHGRLWYRGHALHSPEERDAFALIGIAYVEPYAREGKRPDLLGQGLRNPMHHLDKEPPSVPFDGKVATLLDRDGSVILPGNDQVQEEPHV